MRVALKRLVRGRAIRHDKGRLGANHLTVGIIPIYGKRKSQHVLYIGESPPPHNLQIPHPALPLGAAPKQLHRGRVIRDHRLQLGQDAIDDLIEVQGGRERQHRLAQRFRLMPTGLRLLQSLDFGHRQGNLASDLLAPDHLFCRKAMGSVKGNERSPHFAAIGDQRQSQRRTDRKFFSDTPAEVRGVEHIFYGQRASHLQRRCGQCHILRVGAYGQVGFAERRIGRDGQRRPAGLIPTGDVTTVSVKQLAQLVRQILQHGL